MTQSAWKRSLVLLSLVLVILFGVMLGNRPYYVPDGARYTEIPREMVASKDYLTPHLNGVKYFEKPPLFYWMQAGAIKTFGLSEQTAQLPTALLAIIGCLINLVVGVRLFNRRTGLLASFILGTMLLYFALAHLITLDFPLTIFLTASIYLFALATRAPPGRSKRAYFWGAMASAALAVMTKGLIGILLPGAIAFAWLLCFKQWRQLKTLGLITGLVIFLLVSIPWHVAVQLRHPEFFHFYVITQQFARFFRKDIGHYEVPWYFVDILLLGAYPWTVFLPQALVQSFSKAARLDPAFQVRAFLWLAVGIIFGFFSCSGSKLIPYILPVFPPLALLIADTLSQRWDLPVTRSMRLSFAALFACALLGFIGLISFTTYQPVPDPVLANCYLAVMGASLLVGSWITWLVLKRRGLAEAVTSLIGFTLLAYLALIASSAHLGGRTTKPLAATILAQVRSNDLITSYTQYYQDLPLYLQQTITLVGYQDEMKFGYTHSNASNYLSTEAFWKVWSSPRRVFMVAKKQEFNNAKAHHTGPFYILNQTRRDILVSNQAGSEQ